MKAITKAARRPRRKPVPPGYWKNPDNRELMRSAIRKYLSRNPHATTEELARHFGYVDFRTVHQLMRQGKGDSFRLGDLGKVQETGKHGGFRRKRPAPERRALYKRVLQSVIREPFKKHSAIAAELGITPFAFTTLIRDMQNFDSMPPDFITTQRLKLIYEADTGNLTRKELASKLHIDKATVLKYGQRIEKIKEFALTHKKPVGWVINRYGTLVKAGLLK